MYTGTDLIIDRPICIFGTGRSGTTLFLDLVSRHPSLTWFSNYTNRFPKFPELAALSRVLDIPGVGTYLNPKWPLTPKPKEAVPLVRYLTNGTFTQPRPLTKQDATPETIKRYRHHVAAHIRFHGKDRFVQKHTGFPRIGYLSEVFPDAYFINVIRDGRAVVNSTMHIRWWDGTMKSWWWGSMNPNYQQEYLASDKEPAVLAAIIWKTIMDHNEEARAEVPTHRYFTVRYDRLVADPRETMAQVLKFSDLSPSSTFQKRIATVPVRDEDSKWKRQLTKDQIAKVEKCLDAHLARYGYTD